VGLEQRYLLMSGMTFPTPQEAEDAYYDALESGDLDALLNIWDDADDIVCALPLRPLVMGRPAVTAAWREVLDAMPAIDLQVRHLQWIQGEDLAIHFAEELPEGPPGGPAMPVYAINVFRRGSDGWRLIAHQNAPAPPPQGAAPPPGFPRVP